MLTLVEYWTIRLRGLSKNFRGPTRNVPLAWSKWLFVTHPQIDTPLIPTDSFIDPEPPLHLLHHLVQFSWDFGLGAKRKHPWAPRISLDWREIHQNSLAVTCARKCCDEQLALFLRVRDLPLEISTLFVTHSFARSFHTLEYYVASSGTGISWFFC